MSHLYADDIDSLKAILSTQDFAEKAEVARQLFVAYSNSNLDSALYFAKVSSEYATYAGDSLLLSRAEFCIGWALDNKGFYQDAIDHYAKSLSIANNNNYDSRKKYILNNLANANYLVGNYDDALKYHFESLRIREQEGNMLEVAISLNNIGLVYYKIRDFKNAISFFNQSVKIKKEIQNEQDIESVLVNLGLCYSELEQYKKAIEYFDQVLNICQEGCSDRMKIEALNGAGIANYNLGEIVEADRYFNSSNELAVGEDYQVYRVINDHYLAKVKLDRDELEEAKSYINRSLALAEHLGYRTWIRDNYQLLGKIKFDEGEFKEAYKYQIIYDSLSSLILNEEVIQNLTQIQVEYRERENIETISNQKSELSKRTTLLVLSAIIILLAIVILVILYKSNHHRRKVNKELSVANEKLSEANDTIERQNQELTDVNFKLEEIVKDRTKELKATNAALLKSNNELDNFIYKTSHDIRGPLATLQGVCNVALIDIKDERAIDYFQKLGNTARNLNEILSKLLIINQINNSLISDDKIDFDSLIDSIVKEQKTLKRAKNISVNKEIDDNLYFKSDVDLLKIILNNLIGNSFKFYNTSNRLDSFVTIRIFKEKDLVMQVIDNGIGIEDKASDKIFEIFSKASEMADSAGLGLYLVKLAVEKLEGEIALVKTEEGHTCFHVTIPQG
ncbi:ATP-binding protein [Fulvivirga ligni]|uniref:ATP-binding protein n=1 Tax=Fulvivirga ligni TaxID=2904246 RepID=UPI001F3B6006|nr:tetratricopeptide repeat-containing sensor histidine kinase [Fulvivirga ligni]UII23510.1 tetratricopeptide repeat-containing sensor histidine kinase [Fulvivirga ligni]